MFADVLLARAPKVHADDDCQRRLVHTQTTSWTARLKSTVTTADKRTTRDTSSMKLEYGAGNTAIDGRMNMDVVGITSATGTNMIMTTTGTKI